jgi:hypothetical protein
MSFLAYCYICEKKVNTSLKRKGEKERTPEEIRLALNGGADIWVGHPGNPGNHEWKLNRQEKENLLRAIERGDVK